MSELEVLEEEVVKHFNAKYSDELCPTCENRIDNRGLCTCGAGGE